MLCCDLLRFSTFCLLMALPATQPLRPSSHRLPAPSQETSISTKPCQRAGGFQVPLWPSMLMTLTGAPMRQPSLPAISRRTCPPLRTGSGSEVGSVPGPSPQCPAVHFLPHVNDATEETELPSNLCRASGQLPGVLHAHHPPQPHPRHRESTLSIP